MSTPAFSSLFSPTLVAIAFFDTKWSQAVIFQFLRDYRTAHSSSRPVKNSIFLNPSVPLYSLLQLLVRPCLFYVNRCQISSVVHVIRIHAIYDKNRAILFALGTLYGAQIVVTAICCAFYRCALPSSVTSTTLTCLSAVPLLQGQGCIAGPKAAWVGIYWLMPTLLYTASVGLMTSIIRRSYSRAFSVRTRSSALY